MLLQDFDLVYPILSFGSVIKPVYVTKYPWLSLRARWGQFPF